MNHSFRLTAFELSPNAVPLQNFNKKAIPESNEIDNWKARIFLNFFCHNYIIIAVIKYVTSGRIIKW